MIKRLFLIFALFMLGLFVSGASAWKLETNSTLTYRGTYSACFQITNANHGATAYYTNFTFSRGILKYKRTPLMYWTVGVTNVSGPVCKLNVCRVNGTNMILQACSSSTNAFVSCWKVYFMLPPSSIK